MDTLTHNDRIGLLSTNVGRVDYRLSYSEQLHRKVGEDADIYHYKEKVPFIVMAGLIGAAGVMCLGYFFNRNK